MSTTPQQQPLMPPPAPAPPTNAIWWVLGILGGLLVVLVLGGMIVGTFLLRSIRIQKNAQRVEISTPLGKMEVQKTDARSTGLPVYPNAVPAPDDKGASVDLSFLGNPALNIAAEKYVTSEPKEMVAQWYTAQLGPDFHLEKPGAEETVEWNGKKFPVVVTNPGVMVYVDNGGEELEIVALKPSFSATRIDLLRIGKKEVQ